jgi:hypothetical protein
VTLQLHGRKDREGLTENLRVNVGAVALDDSRLFQGSLPALTARWRQADDLGELGAGFSCVRPQGPQNFLIKRFR